MALARLTTEPNVELEIVRGPGEDQFILRHIVGGALAEVPDGASLEISCDFCARWSNWIDVKPVDAGQWSRWSCGDCANVARSDVTQ
jgi:hypothetical protein